MRRDTDVQVWNPFREFDDVQRRMTELLESAFDGTRASGPTGWTPPVDIEETDEAFVVEAELPGVKRKDVTLEVQDNELSIRGQATERERVGVLRRQTRRTGEFNYRVRLPGELDVAKVEAAMTDGVLQVTVPKAEKAGARRVEIARG